MKWQKGQKRVAAEADEFVQKWRCRCLERFEKIFVCIDSF